MKILKILFKSFLALILLFLIFWVSIIGILQTKKGQKWAIHRIRGYIENQTELKFKVKAIRFSFPLTIELRDLLILQTKHHPLASIEEIRISCNAPYLLNGRIVFSEFQASGIDLFQLPSSNKTQSHWDMTPLPLYLKFSHLDFQNIRIHSDLLQKLNLQKDLGAMIAAASFNLQGMLSNNPFKKSIEAHLQLKTMLSDPSLTIGADAQNQQFSFSVHLSHLPLQKFNPKWPEDMKGDLAFYASASIQQWQSLFQDSLGEKIAGHFKFILNSSIPQDKISLKSQFLIQSDGLELSDLKLKNRVMMIDGKGAIQGGEKVAKGFFDLKGNYQNIPGEISSHFDLLDLNKLVFSDLKIKGLKTQAEGNLTCFFPDWSWNGTLHAKTDDLGEISKLTRYPLQGSGELKIDFHHKDIFASFLGKKICWSDVKANQIEIDLQFRNENLEGSWNAQTINWDQSSMKRAEGTVVFPQPFDLNRSSHSFRLLDIQSSSLNLEELSGTTSIQQDVNPFHIQIMGNQLQFLTEGTWVSKNDSISIQTQMLKGRIGSFPLSLKESFQFMKSSDQMNISHLHLQIGEGEIQGEYSLVNEFVSANIKTSPLPFGLFHFAAPDLPLMGHATFEGTIEGNRAHPKGHFQIDLQDVQINEQIFVQKPLITGRVFLEIDEKGTHIESQLHGIGSTPLTVTGSVPLQLSLDPPALNVNGKLPFQLFVNAEGELDPYLHLFFNDTTTLAGRARASLVLSGQLESPDIKGSVRWEEGSYESLTTGALFHDIHAQIEGDGKKLLLTQFSAKDNDKGLVRATGQLLLEPEHDFPFEIQVDPSEIYLLNSDYATISASGLLHWKGNIKKSTLTGNLTVEKAIVRLEETLPKPIKTVDFKMIESGENQIKSDLVDKGSSVHLDVFLKTKDHVLIQGNHLKSEWKGELNATGSLENIQLHGDLRLSNGEYDFNGKNFTLTQGTLHFFGSPDKKTTLYIVASKEIDRIKADIIVKGAPNKPEVSFRSTPPLSQREILSYILFSRGISDITPDQGDQLSQSFISLNAQTSTGDDFLTRMRKNMGIDRLDFTTQDNENKHFGLQIGKNITENVTVSVNQGVSSLSPIFSIEAKVFKNIKVQAEGGVMQDAPIRMSLKWKKDY